MLSMIIQRIYNLIMALWRLTLLIVMLVEVPCIEAQSRKKLCFPIIHKCMYLYFCVRLSMKMKQYNSLASRNTSVQKATAKQLSFLVKILINISMMSKKERNKILLQLIHWIIDKKGGANSIKGALTGRYWRLLLGFQWVNAVKLLLVIGDVGNSVVMRR